MRYRAFPRIPAVPVSVLGFGCMRLPVLGGDMKRIDEDAGPGLLRRAIDAGVNYVDTAYPYHGGQSEPFVGRALKDGYRDQVQLATKLPGLAGAGRGRLGAPAGRAAQAAGHRPHRLLPAARPQRGTLGDGPAAPGPAGHGAGQGRRPDPPPGLLVPRLPEVFRTILDGYDWAFCQIQFNFMDQGFQAGLRGLRYAAAARHRGHRHGAACAAAPWRCPSPTPSRRIWARSPERRHPGRLGAALGLEPPGGGDRPVRHERPDAQLGENLATAGAAQAAAWTPRTWALVEEVRAIYAARHAGPLHHLRLLRPVPQRRGHPGGVLQPTTPAPCSELEGRRLALPTPSWPARATAPSSARNAARASPSAPSGSPSWRG